MPAAFKLFLFSSPEVILIRKYTLWISFFCLLAYLPFLNKGVSNDDLVFLDYAKRLTKNPAVCAVSDYLFLGQNLKDLVVFESTHPPLVPYVLRVALFLFGENLVALHLVMGVFLWLSALSLAWLIGCYTKHSPYLALAICLGPLFLPNATSLMTDVALFACWFAAIACWERVFRCAPLFWGRWQLLACLFSCAAFFTAYQGLGLLFILLLMGVMRGRSLHALGWCLLCLAPFAAWILAVWVNYDILPFFSPPRSEVSIANEIEKGLVLSNILLKARALLFYVGAGLVFLLPLLAWRKSRGGLFLGCAGWGLAISAYLFPLQGFWFSVYACLLAACGLLSLVVVCDALWRAWRGSGEDRRVGSVLLACIAGFSLFQILLASFAAPRYSLILVAALFILALRALDPAACPRQSWFLKCSLLASVALGLLVAYAEQEYADAQRIERLVLPEGALYFAGEKGLKYNGEKAGFRYFLPEHSEQVHHLLVPQEIDHLSIPRALLANAELLETFIIESSLPIRVMNRAAQAGFYIHNRGMIPFVFSSLPIETFSLYRLFHPGHPWWREREYKSKPAGAILPDAPIFEDFTCLADGLTSFRLMLATYNRVNHSSLVISLFTLDSLDNPAEEVFRQVLDAATLVDNSWLQVDFAPLASKGQRYRMMLHSPDASPSTAVTIWSNSNGAGSFHRGKSVIGGALAFESLCAPK